MSDYPETVQEMIDRDPELWAACQRGRWTAGRLVARRLLVHAAKCFAVVTVVLVLWWSFLISTGFFEVRR